MVETSLHLANDLPGLAKWVNPFW